MSILRGRWTMEKQNVQHPTSNIQYPLTKDVALADAKKYYLKTHETGKSNPFFWAGFVLVGNTDGLNFEKPTPSFSYWIYSVLCLALGIFGFLKYRGLLKK